MLEELKKVVYEANMELPKYGLVTFTWGNVSAIDRETGYFVIKPSGVDYDKLKPEDMVVMDLNMNKILDTSSGKECRAFVRVTLNDISGYNYEACLLCDEYSTNKSFCNSTTYESL